MKTAFVLAVAAVALLSFAPRLTAAEATSGSKSVKTEKSAKSDQDANQPSAKLNHMVAFKFKETATPEDIRKVEKAFAALIGKIPQIVSYQAGTNVSPENLNKGCTHAFLLTFDSAKDRDAYLVHPEHKAFGTLIGPYVADVFVIDFWGKKAKQPKKAK